MSSSRLIEVFGHIVFSFTRGVTEHYNSQEPENTAESFGYDPLQSTGREWYYHPVDELIYQEYSDREATSLDYLASNHPDIRVINACSPEENEETQEDQQDEDGEMAWKRLRPSPLQTVCKSMYIGALISLLTATIIGSVYVLISYLCYKTVFNCEFHPKKSINFACDPWYYATAFALCDCAISISSISVNGREKETDVGFLFWILFGRILHHSSASLRNISFQTNFFTTDSSQHYLCYKSVFASLFCNYSLLYTTEKEKSSQVFPSNDSCPHFSSNSWNSCG